MQIESPSANKTPINLFYSYAPEDDALRIELEKQLISLRREGLIAPWHKGSITGGSEWEQAILEHLNAARLILLLISPDFLASDLCYSTEMGRALERHRTGEVCVIPLLLRPCDWQKSPFSHLQPLPKDRTFVVEQPNRDRAFLQIVEDIRHVIETLPTPQLQPPSQLPTSTPTLSPHIFTIPFARNPYFTGRADILKQLHNALNSNKPAALTQTQAISGLGGIGKTQTAIEYAYQHENDYTYILWVRAEKREELISDFAALATPLNLLEKDEKDQNRIVAAVQKWLAAHTGWLLILDNADDLSMAKEFIPSTAKGHVILTTRSQISGRLAQMVEIEKMDSEEGTLFLLHRTGILDPDASLEAASPADVARTKEIVLALDGLPLALDQAAAYIVETECGLAGYLQRYQKQRNILLLQRGDLVFEHPESVATTWKLSFQKVEQADPAAADLLRLCAFLAPDAIPEEIFAKEADELGTEFQRMAADPVKLDAAVKELRKYSLVKRDPDRQELTVHRLVQAVLKDEMDEETQRQWAESAVRAVASTFPYVEYETWPACERLLPHARVCIQLIEQWKMEFPKVGRLLNRMGWYLRERLQYAEAEPLFQKSLALPEHPYLASNLNNLALLYQEQGKYAQAEPLYQQALQIYEKAYGLEHPYVAANLNNLARLYRSQGRYTEAESLLQRALAIREKAIQPDHPDMANSLNSLAELYRVQGKYAEAESLFQRALVIDEKAYGLEHPKVATDLNNLALFYHTQGKHTQAEAFYQRALAILEKTLAIHPHVAICLENYARLLKKTRREDEAAKLRERAQEIREKHARENLMKGD